MVERPFKNFSTITLECGIDHSVGLCRRFALFHPCFEKNVHHVVQSLEADFSGAICDQIIGHQLSHHLSTDTPKFTVGQVVQILQPLKVQHFFKILKNAGN